MRSDLKNIIEKYENNFQLIKSLKNIRNIDILNYTSIFFMYTCLFFSVFYMIDNTLSQQENPLFIFYSIPVCFASFYIFVLKLGDIFKEYGQFENFLNKSLGYLLFISLGIISLSVISTYIFTLILPAFNVNMFLFFQLVSFAIYIFTVVISVIYGNGILKDQEFQKKSLKRKKNEINDGKYQILESFEDINEIKLAEIICQKEGFVNTLPLIKNLKVKKIKELGYNSIDDYEMERVEKEIINDENNIETI